MTLKSRKGHDRQTTFKVVRLRVKQKICLPAFIPSFASVFTFSLFDLVCFMIFMTKSNNIMNAMGSVIKTKDREMGVNSMKRVEGDQN